MKYRGYGTAKRTAYSIFRFAPSDFVIMSVTVICTTAIIILFASGKAYYLYYPEFILPLTDLKYYKAPFLSLRLKRE